MAALITQALNRNMANRATLTYYSTIANLPNASQKTPYFILPDGCTGWTANYVTSGSGSLQLAQLCNDDREVSANAPPFPLLPVNVGSASTGGTAATTGSQQPVCVLVGTVTGGSGTDTVEITICASFIKS
jgi:hypothetical protein